MTATLHHPLTTLFVTLMGLAIILPLTLLPTTVGAIVLLGIGAAVLEVARCLWLSVTRPRTVRPGLTHRRSSMPLRPPRHVDQPRRAA